LFQIGSWQFSLVWEKGEGQLLSEFEGRLPFVSFGSFCELVEEMASFFVCHRGEERKKGKDEVNDQKEGVSHHLGFLALDIVPWFEVEKVVKRFFILSSLPKEILQAEELLERFWSF
jgi:hypothetical protein